MILMENERIYFDVLANLFRGIEAVGGKLMITDRRLIFKSHTFNIQTGTTEILIEEITEVKKRNTLKIVPNGISVITKNGVEYNFVLWNRRKIFDFLNKSMTKF